ncbi:MAG TPA: thioredoxin domain-containing protein [Candidatus Paceibacterota bacterium]|nr:thioredoxin domain-containing protein [Candidatus Paceibacterota bacterium]
MPRKTELWIVGGFVVAVVVIAILAVLFGSNAPSSSFSATTVPPITAADHARGDTSGAKLTVIEYGDFECPACGQYEPIVEQLTQQYGNKVEFIFRNFPLYQIHPFAMISAQAAEAAALQGKYWEMHDLLYKNQTLWTAATNLTPSDVVSKYFDVYAQQLGLNVTQFNSDINSTAVKNRVQKDLDSGNAAYIDHTPTFFFNLTQIQNPTSLAEFQKDIDTALASSTAQ